MAWIESHTVTIRHPKLIESAAELRLKPVYFLGHLHALWHATLELREDGDISSWNDETIAHAAQYQGDASKFVSLLHSQRWLDDAGTIHDWLDYAGKYLTGKYAKRNKERLAEIWKKYGRVYGSGERPTERQQTANQQSVSGRVGELNSKDSFSPKDSSSLERAKNRPKMHPPPKTVEDLAQLFAATYTGMNREMRDVYALTPFFAELHRQGHSISDIAEKISSDRSTNESTAQFEINAGYQKLGQKNGKPGGHLGPGRIAVDQAALDQNERRRAAQKARSDEFAAKNPSAEPGPGAGIDPAGTPKGDP